MKAQPWHPLLPKHHSLSSALLLFWLALVVYASLFPFAGWRIPPGVALFDLLRLPWTRWIAGFDAFANLVGYAPLGFLLVLSSRATHGSLIRAVAWAVVWSSLLSFGMEVLQQFVPSRVPTARDWVMNSLGAVLGAALAVVVEITGWRARWRWMHDRWLDEGGTGAALLLMLWPMALLFPSPLPFGLGQVGEKLREWGVAALDGVAWAAPMSAWLENAEVLYPAPPATEVQAAVLGLLSPVLLAYAASRPGWRRLWLAAGTPVVAVAAMSLSTALNFGPQHALAWMTPAVVSALGLSTVVSLALVWGGPTHRRGLGPGGGQRLGGPGAHRAGGPVFR